MVGDVMGVFGFLLDGVAILAIGAVVFLALLAALHDLFSSRSRRW